MLIHILNGIRSQYAGGEVVSEELVISDNEKNKILLRISCFTVWKESNCDKIYMLIENFIFKNVV